MNKKNYNFSSTLVANKSTSFVNKMLVDTKAKNDGLSKKMHSLMANRAHDNINSDLASIKENNTSVSSSQ